MRHCWPHEEGSVTGCKGRAPGGNRRERARAAAAPAAPGRADAARVRRLGGQRGRGAGHAHAARMGAGARGAQAHLRAAGASLAPPSLAALPHCPRRSPTRMRRGLGALGRRQGRARGAQLRIGNLVLTSLPFCPCLCMAGPPHCAGDLVAQRQDTRRRPCILHCTAAGSPGRACVCSAPHGSAPARTRSPTCTGARRSCGGKLAAGARPRQRRPSRCASASMQRATGRCAARLPAQRARCHRSAPAPRLLGSPQAAPRRARGERGGRAARRWKACGPTRPWRRSLNTWTGGRPRQTRRPPPWTPRRSMRTPPARPARVQSAAARHGVPRRVTRTSRAIYMLRLRSLPQGSDRPLCWSPGRPCCPCIQDGLGALCAQLRFEDSHFPVDAEASSLGDAAVLLDRF